ncbi:hypothetical protein GUJ93_ZPchr0005g14597 [Zizania palustris]|uniref:Hpc2-related domain-containing protein n=1 Tax=Zizania palustris TaxID=103762 RepID=A0A8J5SH26_ZIZPA|nr:hypothetical protein GUJ93_ZPchr0005g14597 [Zizania palustris]
MGDPAVAPRVAAPATVTLKPPEDAVDSSENRAPVAGVHRGAVAPPPAAAPAVATTAVAGGREGGRRVFSVELRPGETTIVSWKKMLKEAGLGAALLPPLPAAATQPVVASLPGPSGATNPTENDPAQSNRFSSVIEKIERLYVGKNSSDEEDLDDVPDDDQYDTEDSFIDDDELDEYFEVDNLATKHNGYFVNKGKLEQIELGSVHTSAPKKRIRKDSIHFKISSKDVPLPPSEHLATKSHTEGSATKTKGTRLERAIRDLQNIVTEYKPQILHVREAEPNCLATVKRRLPQEVKQKLAKVARLSANQGKIPEQELINRLMGIVGHLVHRRTLKRNMKEMVESGLCAKQERADKLQQVKMEIYEIIKARLATKPKVTEHKDGSTDGFQDSVNNDEGRASQGKSVMDAVLEDRICDLYDLYVEGMDEDKGPQSRKLYVELADLWPHGHMDKAGIRDAISRSKERRNLLYKQRKVRNEERMKRRRLAAAAKLQGGDPAAPQSAQAQQIMQQQPMKVLQPPMTSTHTMYPVPNYGHSQGSRNVDKVRETSVSQGSDHSRSSADVKKRKTESDSGDRQANPPRAALQHHRIEKTEASKASR